MIRGIVLATAFVTALGVASFVETREARAQWGRGAGPVYSGYGYGGYGNIGVFPTGGYQAAAIRMGTYTPDYFYNNNSYYGGYPYGLGGNVGPVGGVYGGSSNTIIIGF